MVPDQRNWGVPFPGVFPDWTSDTPGATPADVQWQVQQLAELRYQPWVRHEWLRQLEERRRDGGADVVQFDYLPVDVGFDLRLVRNQLLITTESLRGYAYGSEWKGRTQGAAAYLEALGLHAVPVPCAELSALVQQVVPVDPDRQLGRHELANIARDLRSRGFSASLTNVTPTAPVTKPPPISPNAAAPLPQAQARAKARAETRDQAKPRPVKVAIIDTGIADQQVHRADYLLDQIVRTPENIDRLHQFPLGGPDQYLDFDAGHGTFVAGIVDEVAPDATISVYRAIDSDGIGSEVDVACAMIQAVRDGNQIINLSLGCQTQDDFPPIALRAALTVIAGLDAAKPDGDKTLFVAAAGNYADTRPCWPAAFPGVISVAGLNPNMTPSPWSSRGSWVTCSTIGQGLLSTYVYGTENPLVDPAATTFAPPDPFAVWSGTSFAAPQIAGAVARLYQVNGALTIGGALDELLQVAVPIPDFGLAVQILKGI